MPYTEVDYPSKKALKLDFQAGKVIRVFQPGPFGPNVRDGENVLEGPHFPKPHSWYARVKIKDGKVVKIMG